MLAFVDKLLRSCVEAYLRIYNSYLRGSEVGLGVSKRTLIEVKPTDFFSRAIRRDCQITSYLF